MVGTYALSSGYYEAYYLQAQKARTLIKGDFDRAFESFDVLAVPTAPSVAFPLGAKVECRPRTRRCSRHRVSSTIPESIRARHADC